MLLNTNTSASHDSNKQIRIGNQTSFVVVPTLPFEYAIQNGFDAFEWFPDKKSSRVGWDLDDIDSDKRAYIKKRALKHDIRLSVHVPWWANPLISKNHEVMFDCFKFADDIKAALVNIHLYTENGLANYAKSILPFIKCSNELNITLAIENTPLTTPDDFNILFDVLQKQDLHGIKQVGICFDIGHANLCSATLNDYIGFLDQVNINIPLVHMHLHENYGDYDRHLPLYTGPAGKDDAGVCALMERLKGRSFLGSMILEQWPEPPMLLCEVRDRLRRIIT